MTTTTRPTPQPHREPQGTQQAGTPAGTPAGTSAGTGGRPTPAERLARLRRLPTWLGSRLGPDRSPRAPLPEPLRARRRRLLLATAPLVVLLAFIAGRLLTLNLVHAQTLEGYRAADKARTLTWGERQDWVNLVEQFRSAFAIGDAHVLSGHYALARPWFEKAFAQVPKGGLDECKVRVNLGLTYEALGDAAKARERTDEWKQFYDKGIAITKGRPPLCEAPEGGRTGDQLRDAQQRMEQKSSDAPPEQDKGDEPGQEPPQPTPTPDPEKAPSQEQQDALREQQRQNTVERNERRGNDDRVAPDGGIGSHPKPW